MWKRAAATWQRLTGSLWFIPALMTAGAALLAVGLIEAEALVRDEALERFPRLFGAGAESRRPMGIAVVGGMITSTFLTLVIIPVVYTVFHDLGARFRRHREPEPSAAGLREATGK